MSSFTFFTIHFLWSFFDCVYPFVLFITSLLYCVGFVRQNSADPTSCWATLAILLRMHLPNHSSGAGIFGSLLRIARTRTGIFGSRHRHRLCLYWLKQQHIYHIYTFWPSPVRCIRVSFWCWPIWPVAVEPGEHSLVKSWNTGGLQLPNIKGAMTLENMEKQWWRSNQRLPVLICICIYIYIYIVLASNTISKLRDGELHACPESQLVHRTHHQQSFAMASSSYQSPQSEHTPRG